jgi:hypothetical protein
MAWWSRRGRSRGAGGCACVAPSSAVASAASQGLCSARLCPGRAPAALRAWNPRTPGWRSGRTQVAGRPRPPGAAAARQEGETSVRTPRERCHHKRRRKAQDRRKTQRVSHHAGVDAERDERLLRVRRQDATLTDGPRHLNSGCCGSGRQLQRVAVLYRARSHAATARRGSRRGRRRGAARGVMPCRRACGRHARHAAAHPGDAARNTRSWSAE